MKYMLLHYVDESARLSPEQAAKGEADLSAWVEDTTRSGVNLHGDRLRPVPDATTVRIRNEELLVADGPFAETKEQVAGYDVIECADLDDAIEIAARHPVARLGTVEIRPILTSHDQPATTAPLDE